MNPIEGNVTRVEVTLNGREVDDVSHDVVVAYDGAWSVPAAWEIYSGVDHGIGPRKGHLLT